MKKKKLTEYDKSWCSKLINEVWNRTISQPFQTPVDPDTDGAPDYFEVIKKPMDLSTMKSKLNKGIYKSLKEVQEDFHLIFQNTRDYNEEDSIYSWMADDLEEWIEKKFKNKSDSFETEWNQNLLKVTKKIRLHLNKAPSFKRWDENEKNNIINDILNRVLR